MILSSFEYLLFFPIVFLLYWFLFNKTAKLQNLLLIISSLVFYGLWDVRFLVLLLITAFSTFYIGKLIDKENLSSRNRKSLLIGAIILNIGILFYYKYFNFFIDTVYSTIYIFNNNFIGKSTLNILLPVGISFYTFSALSYTIDVYMKKVRATSDLLAYLAYVTFFPSILSGPISRATQQLPQYFEKRTFDYNYAITAIKLILWGVFMKTCIADNVSIYVDSVYNNLEQHNGTTLYIAAILYSIQIYADFAGYSLIAIGSGKLLGINLQTNFIRPYFSKSVTEFWRKWHISLTTWFRDYIYFPLGGNRVSKLRWILNTMVVFILSGLWHGAAWTFIIWGTLHGLMMVIERLIYGNKLKNISDKLTFTNVIRIITTFNIVTFAWIFFRINSLSDALYIIKEIFSNIGTPFIDISTLLVSFMGIIIMTMRDAVYEWNIPIHLLHNKNTIIRYTTCILLICYILLFGALSGGSFIYFQF